MSESPRSYRIILPPAWIRIPVGDGTEAAIGELLDAQFAGAPMDKYGPRRSRVEASIRDAAASARESGGIDLIFPIGTPWMVPVSAGIVISRNAAPQTWSVGPAEVLKSISASIPGSSLVETSAGTAVRETTDHRAGLTKDPVSIARLFTMTYTWLIPQTANELFLATFSVTGETTEDYAPIVEALTTLVDAMLQSVVWDYPGSETA